MRIKEENQRKRRKKSDEDAADYDVGRQIGDDAEDRGIAEAGEVLRMLTSVMRGKVGEPVIVIEQTTGASGKVEKSARVLEKRASVRERMSAAEMLARRYGILDDDGGESIEFVGEEKFGNDSSDGFGGVDGDVGGVGDVGCAGGVGALSDSDAK